MEATTEAVLLGGVIGSVLSSVANFFLAWCADKRRWKRENFIRHHPERLAAYRDFYSTIDINTFGIEFDENTGEHKIDYTRLESGMQTLRSCRAEVLLLTSSEEVRQACESASDSSLDFALKLQLESDEQPISELDLDYYIKQLAYIKDHFLKVARRDLGIVEDRTK